MPVNVVTWLRPRQHGVVYLDALYGGHGGHGGMDGYHDVPLLLHSRQSSVTPPSRPSSIIDMASSPASVTTTPVPAGSRIGRPPQWTISRSRKLARLYLYSTLSIEKIIKALEDDGFNPRKNSAQKTIHKMLDNDPRYLRPESRAEMSKRINSLSMSPARRRRRKGGEDVLPSSEVTSPSGQSVKTEDTPSFDFSASPDVSNLSYFSIPSRGQEQGNTAPEQSETAHPVIQDIKRRVSECSTHYALQLCALIKEFTISISSDDQFSGRRLSVALSEGPNFEAPEFETAPDPYESFPDPGFALPGDFLTAHRRSCADFPGQQHGQGDCWCSIAKETSADERSWLLPTGELSERARRAVEHPSLANINVRDSFGNTPLHLCAALGEYQDTLLKMVASSDNGILRAVNTAGQTFLHVLNVEWFSDLSSPSTPLKQLLAYVQDSCPELVYESDVYGRSLFHRAHSLIRNPSLLASLISLFNPALASRRDAFGFNPVSDTDPASQSPYVPPRRTDSFPVQVQDLTCRGASPNSRPQSSTSDGTFLAYHARLVQVIQSSYTNPTVEDADGRNGLHCLAEAILNQQTMDRHVRSSSSSSSSSATTSITTGTTTTTATNNRSNHLKRKLDSKDPPTSHIPDDQDDKVKTLQAILETLLMRNRRGETALLVAARLGRKVALTTLLEMGASVHVRDVDGRGVLEVIDCEIRGGRARGDVGLYARLEACRVLLTGRREWGVGYAVRPGEGAVVREWRVVV
ncbi:KN motif and ankyrin repeat domain-containing protein 3 [Chaetomidium leptoderma]|uniref:KN motif and ankyrin repeat domain-containing protein 3 n=1 Tax=Chaetomidium leptoderma TaxID=669021 RepID=A0AAN6ZTN9_9PEZI|nr:KN motif and ankyrin repeat domain-containing protein 3 [Chaetomidium leptoderma]